MKCDTSDQKRSKSDRTRNRITEAFIAICGERGSQAASVAEIARRAGVDRATFYRHFEDRPDLVERGVVWLLESIFREIDASAPPLADPADRIRARMTRFFEIARERQATFRSLLSGAAGPTLLAKTQDFVEGFLRERRLGAAGKRGLAMPLSLASRALTFLIFGCISWWVDYPRSYSAAEVASVCLESSRGFFRSPPSKYADRAAPRSRPPRRATILP